MASNRNSHHKEFAKKQFSENLSKLIVQYVLKFVGGQNNTNSELTLFDDNCLGSDTSFVFFYEDETLKIWRVLISAIGFP